MQICNKCILPDTFPNISFDENGVCNYCNDHIGNKIQKDSKGTDHFDSEEELISSLEKYKNPKNKYDVLVSLSGGVDSTYALINIVEKFKLKPLCFHNDYSFKDETAVNNVKKVCKALNVDYIIWRNDYSFMKKVWKYANESQIVGMSGCYFCGNIVHLNAIELADRFGIKLVINGLSKGQTWTINDVNRTREIMGKMTQSILKDKEFFYQFMKKNDMLLKQKFYQDKKDLNEIIEEDKILILPFFIFKFYKTDKELLKKECMSRFDWEQPKITYPSRTTNCEMSWINSYCDLKKMGYSTYHEEYSHLIREGEITREQALSDLEMNPPEGFIEMLADEIDLKL